MKSVSNTVIIGISGASSSGKTTLCRLLMDVFPNIFIVHEDDFFKPENEIPSNDGFQNWECVEALYWQDVIESLKNIRQHGTPAMKIDGAKPFPSFEDQAASCKCPVSKDVITRLQNKVTSWLAPGQPGHKFHSKKICLFEGFLLYSRSTSDIWPFLDLKIFIQASEKSVKFYREQRNSYFGTDGFWEDPPNYINNVVWPSYCRDHKWLFENGDVEGKLLESPDSECRILSLGGIDLDLETALIRIVHLLMKELPILVKD